MNAKEYLLQARYLDERITSKTQQIASLNDLATRCTTTFSDMPRNPNRGGSRLEDCIIKILDLEDELKADIAKLVNLKKEIMEVIKAVPNVEYQTLLEKRYLCFITWEQIAVDMNYSMQHVHRMHSAALKEIVVPEKDESQCDRMRVLSYDSITIAKKKITGSLVGHTRPTGLFLCLQGGVSFAKTTKETLFLSRLSQPN